jgi:S-adenosylmethionine:tRNA ribosyltransferase-isomerase
MRVDLFDFDLPEERIALRPAHPRDSARLLEVFPHDRLEHHAVRDLPDLLRPGDAVVVNDTKVIAAELHGERHREGGGSVRVSATLHKRLGSSRWRAFARPGKRLAEGDRLRFGADNPGACLLSGLDATVAEKTGEGDVILAFDLAGPDLDDAIAALGHMPLPPYIAGRRAEDAQDRTDYQTVFAREEGAVAAPTAGLHFTDDLLGRLAGRGVTQHRVTLHVGAGTFLPIKTETTEGHRMHAEWGRIDAATAAALNEARARGGRIVAIGTTSLRLLESAATPEGEVKPFAAETDIFIQPGYRFRAVDLLLTNFHLPKSTLFMLVSAFSGLGTMREAYAHAIAAGYRFYSYGDACLLHPETPRA